MTHIENILPEIVGGEVQRLLVSDADGLAAAALYDLVRKATGCRLPQTDSTPSSEVEELLALCSAVLRRHWQAPLTMLDGLSLQELVSRLMADRMLEGDATLGIPAHNGSVTEALSALLDRKITGAPEVADGMSLVQLLCGSAASASLTTLTDPTTGWTMDKAMPWANFPNVTKAQLGTVSITISDATKPLVTNKANLYELELPNLKQVSVLGNKGSTGWGVISKVPITRLYLPSLEKYYTNAHSSSYEGMIWSCDSLEEFIAPKLSYIGSLPNYTDNAMLSLCPALKKIVVGTLTYVTNYTYSSGADSFINVECPNLIHFEIGEGTAVSLRLSKWSPTTALSSNLLQFLSNFREFLFLRLADRTGQSALTLTLSQAVYQAITGTDTTTTALTLTLSQLGITDLTEKETQAGITLDTTYATWLETYRDAINWNIGYV